jgi:hypothetical protein
MKVRKFPRAARLALLLAFVAASIAALVSPVGSAQNKPVRDDISRELQSFDLLTIDTTAAQKQARAGGTLTLQTEQLGQLDLQLEPYDIRTADYRSVAVGADGVMHDLPRTPSNAYKATVAGMSDAHARFIIDGDRLEGIIATPNENYYVEPASAFSQSAAKGQFVFYAASSLKNQAAGECGTTLAQEVGAHAPGAGTQQTTATHSVTSATKGVVTSDAFAPEPTATVATEADFEFTQTFGGNAANTNADIANIITMADAIYEQQLGIKLNLGLQRAWTANNDPYTQTDPGKALDEFRASYNGSFAPNSAPQRDLAHLFTGKVLTNASDGSTGTIGIAYTGTVCDPSDYAYGISESKFNGTNTNPTQRVALTAHEMGHNFGATHPDQETPAPTNCNNSDSIMNSHIETTQNFCPFSRDQITNFVVESATATCLAQSQSGCSYSLSASTQFFPSSGGAGSIGITTGAGCAWGVAEGANWIDSSAAPSGSGSGSAPYTVAANANSGPRFAVVDIAGQKLTVEQAGSPSCAPTQIGFNQSLSGSLAANGCVAGQADRPNAFINLYTFAARAGQRITIDMTAANKPTASPPSPGQIDSFLYLFGPDNSLVAVDDDINTAAGNTDSHIPDPQQQNPPQFFTLPKTGIYTVEATSFDNGSTGAYTIKLSDDSATSTVQLSSNAYTVNEAVDPTTKLGTDGNGFRTITVTRASLGGADINGTATVDYALTDGTASKQSDYTQALGTIVFGPGETTKTFNVFVADDRYNSESPETVNVTLSNPVGTTLGTPSTATLTINNDASNAGGSPVAAASFDTAFYVRQQYLDFLNREPDSSGFAFWQNDINQCGADANCLAVHRINTSAAFFLSIEFQQTGYLVERIYKTAYGDFTGNSTLGGAHTLQVPVVRLSEFLADTQRIGQGVVVGQGNWQQQLDNNKNAFALEFVLRPRFITAYPLTMTPAAFVDQLNQNAGGVLSQSQRDALVAQLAASADQSAGRASVLRQVAENAALTANESNKAFVLMQFFGYLRRNPNDTPDSDYTGYDFWLSKLNQFGGDFTKAEMVKAFLSSTEYINRFGS